MKILRFIQSSPPYMIGELAGFEENVAAQYVRRGFAVYAPQHAEIVTATRSDAVMPDSLKASPKSKPMAPRKRGRPKRATAVTIEEAREALPA